MATQVEPIYKETVQVVGLGYVGLPIAALLASRGYRVYGLEKDPEVVATINQGKVHFVEPQVDVAVRSAVVGGLLTASTEARPADIHVIAVPTPLTQAEGGDPVPDLAYVMAGFGSIRSVLAAGNMVVLESTSPLGTTRKLRGALAADEPGLADQVAFAYCPERVLPGRIYAELIGNDRVVGGLDDTSTERAQAFYRTFVEGEVFATAAEAAEMVKLSENAFRDVNIAFANEIAMICSEYGVNVWDVIRLANRHPRVDILRPGVGVGGHCIPVDPWFLVHASPKNTPLMKASRTVNDKKPKVVVNEIKAIQQQFAAEDRPFRLGVLGVAFKPDVDDLRESPGLEVVAQLQKQGIPMVGVVEPNIDKAPDALGDLPLIGLDRCLKECNVLAFLVPHSEFKKLDPAALLADYAVVDPGGVLVR